MDAFDIYYSKQISSRESMLSRRLQKEKEYFVELKLPQSN
jgi:hypothetical protein